MSARLEAFMDRFFDEPFFFYLSGVMAALGAKNIAHEEYLLAAMAILTSFVLYLNTSTINRDKFNSLKASRDRAWSIAEKAMATLERVEAEIATTARIYSRDGSVSKLVTVPDNAPGKPVYVLGKREPVAYILPDGTRINADEIDEPSHDRAEDA